MTAKVESALRRAMDGLDSRRVNFAKLAEAQLDDSRIVVGWEPPRVLLPEWREIDRDDRGGARYINNGRGFLCSTEW